MPTIALVSCVKQKQAMPCAPKDLYTSTLFRSSRRYAERHADHWFIPSAKYGLVEPGAIVAPYELTLNRTRHDDRRHWVDGVYQQFFERGLLVPTSKILWLAGMNYQSDLSVRLQEFEQHDRLRGKRMGERLAWRSAQGQ